MTDRPEVEAIVAVLRLWCTPDQLRWLARELERAADEKEREE